nr:proton-conducting transporter membrane subunit [Alicyclobacillus mengziensis]
MLNLGIFGMLRVVGWVGSVPAIVGAIISLVGAAAVCLGALYAVFERRLTVLLAYSSIENVGVMLIGIGLSMSFHVTHATTFAGVAMFAMVVQMVSHAIAKSLCFLAVGEVERRTGNDHLDALGGIYAKMPMVATGLLVGSLTLAGVAPFSGFTSEWLTLQSMLQAYRTLAAFPQTIIVLAGALAAIGSALAFTAFLRLFAFLFTGRLRTPILESLITKSSSGRVANAAIAGASVVSALYGFFPTVLVNAYGRIVSFLTVSPSVASDISPSVFHHPEQFSSLMNLGAGLLSFLPMPSAVIEPGALVSSIAPTYVLCWFAVFSLVALLIQYLVKRSKYRTRTVRPWAGGRQLTFETAQYSGTAYSNPYRMFFSPLLRFQVHRRVTSGTSMVPTRVSVHTNAEKWLQSQIYQRLVRAVRKRLSIVTRLQHGYLWGYTTTFLAVLVILLLWAYWS